MNVAAKALMVVLALELIGESVMAHPGHSHRTSSAVAGRQNVSIERTWTALTGAFRERGSFVMARDSVVQIRRDDDTLVSLPIALLPEDDRRWIERRSAEIRRLAEVNGLFGAAMGIEGQADSLIAGLPYSDHGDAFASGGVLLAQADGPKVGRNAVRDQAPGIAAAFEAFVKLKAIQTRWDDRYFYVESNGMPNHQMMVGITAWQQQVPLPQKYVGDNAWQIPLHPVPAEKPSTTKGQFLRGAIAVAVNGVPIFNPLNNRGEDAYLFGELDEFGGHCGRADDYHYHIAPVHLEKVNGAGKPIAYALDGYPIYGYDEPDGSPVKNLDAINGHQDANGNYHYHATKKYPYLNGGFYGVVTERGGQVDPQPRAEPLRPALTPLRDARIIDFKETKPGSYTLTYDVKGAKGSVSYTIANDGSVKFVFVDPTGRSNQEAYSSKQRGPGPGRGPGGGDRRPTRNEDRPPTPRQGGGPPRSANGEQEQLAAKLPKLRVTSSSVDANGFISVDCTCDGTRQSPAVSWKDAPERTKSFAVSLWHDAPDQQKSYWVVYNIPATTTNLAQNSAKGGTLGLNDRRRAEYDPMCSKGPGVKDYHITVYALSGSLDLAPQEASRADLLAAIKGQTLAIGTLDFKYERKGAR